MPHKQEAQFWGKEYVRDYGFAPDAPLIELLPPYQARTYGDIVDVFASCALQRPGALHFGFQEDENWSLVFVPDGFQLVDAPHQSALNGGAWHNDDALWVLSGWAQLCEARSVKLEGRATVLTPRAWPNDELHRDDSYELFTGQLIPFDASQPKQEHAHDLSWVDHPSELVPG